MSDIGSYKRCDSGQCLNVVRADSRYCCSQCRHAWEATPPYEPHEHSEGCVERQLGRAWIGARLAELGR